SEYCSRSEPADEFKGDVARILMYVYIHYSNHPYLNGEYSDTQKKMIGNLKLTDVFDQTYSLEQIQRIMVKWNELDPVDEVELNRNENVKEIQGNGNPFIEHPDYMRRCFGIED
ncbi:MAG: endonuclease, partial [Bacilli bacterium]|nr:endonuclease [Bacilli bacterium]